MFAKHSANVLRKCSVNIRECLQDDGSANIHTNILRI